MRRAVIAALLTGAIVFTTGCQFLANLVQPQNTTIRLVNPGAFPVEVDLYIDNDQNILEALLEDDDNLTQRTVAANSETTLTLDCDQLQALLVNAEVNIIGSIGPQDGTGVFRDGDDFGCGDTIVVTFDYGAVPVNLDIQVTVDPADNPLGL